MGNENQKHILKIKNFSFLVCVFSILFLVFNFCSGCAATSQKPAYKHLPKKSVQKVKIEKERAPETGATKEIIKTEPKPLSAAVTPKARASVKMVEDGRREMAAGNIESAERKFQDAINIDPNNGIAYYYLARAKFELGSYQQANGVLDKAEELLAGSKEWLEAVAALREMIREKQ